MIVDAIVMLLVCAYVFLGYGRGALNTTVEGIGFLLSLLVAILGYQWTAGLLGSVLPLPVFVWHAVAFILLAIVTEAIYQIMSLTLLRFLSQIAGELSSSLIRFDRIAGSIMGALGGIVIVTFFLMLLMALPVSKILKDAISTSVFGSRIVAVSQSIEYRLAQLWGDDMRESLTFWTLPSMGDEVIQLGFTASNPLSIPQAEEEMVRIVNERRRDAGLSPLQSDLLLQRVARDHGRDMLEKGYFSHTGHDGRTPFDRMKDAGVVFVTAGENLALSANAALAMQGLMDSPGHRANILSPLFTKVGIAALDAGAYGIVFTQEFSN